MPIFASPARSTTRSPVAGSRTKYQKTGQGIQPSVSLRVSTAAWTFWAGPP